MTRDDELAADLALWLTHVVGQELERLGRPAHADDVERVYGKLLAQLEHEALAPPVLHVPEFELLPDPAPPRDYDDEVVQAVSAHAMLIGWEAGDLWKAL